MYETTCKFIRRAGTKTNNYSMVTLHLQVYLRHQHYYAIITKSFVIHEGAVCVMKALVQTLHKIINVPLYTHIY